MRYPRQRSEHVKVLSSGFTLVETMVTTAITLVAMALILSIYMTGNDLWESKSYQTDIQGQGREALSAMTKELRETTAAKISFPNTTDIDFYLPEYAIDASGQPYILMDTSGIVWEGDAGDPDDTIKVEYQYDPTDRSITRQEINMINGATTETATIARNVSGIQYALNGNKVTILLTIAKTTPRGRTLSMSFNGIVRLRN